MVPLIVEGETLRQKHRHHNILVNESTLDVLQDISYEEPDLDNLFKIDVACKNRNVEYIMRVLQCEDMLYVSRAIKHSTWLVTDPQYAHIVNPIYLNDHMSPSMMAKAFNKLLLHIRLNLRHEKRVEDFFNYYKKRDLKAAFKWLTNCSIQFTVNILQKHLEDIPEHLLLRLCEKCITHVDIPSSRFSHSIIALENTTFLVRNNVEKYLDIVEAYEAHEKRCFGPKLTKFFMKHSSVRVMKNIEKYLPYIHIPTFAKYIRRENIKDFITTHIKNTKLRPLFTHSKIKPFVNRLSNDERFLFIKDFFIDKNQGDDYENIIEYWVDHVTYKETYLPNTFYWYAYAPFNVAFDDLKKIIRAESISSERCSMLGVMLTSAGKNIKNIHTLLRYYREDHINEPFRFKIQFVNLVITCTATHTFDKETWGYLNDIFSNTGVYSQSDKLQNCVRSILLYNIIHNTSIPEIIEKKFLFDTFKTSRNKFSINEKEKVFSYLYKYLISNIDTLKINDKKDFSAMVELLKKMLNLLVDWNKQLQDFPIILDKIKEIIQIHRQNNWDDNISVLYSVKKSWRKFLFEASIILNSDKEEACLNALKHGPQLLEIYKKEVENLCLNDKKPPVRFLRKIRIYWSQSLANTFQNLFSHRIGEKNIQHAGIPGLCVLIKKNDLSLLVQKYVPNESTADGTHPDDIELDNKKLIASSMYLGRPQPPLATVLLYTKRDYLRYALPSLSSILYNMSIAQTRKHLHQCLDAPVYLQKHCFQIIFAKLTYEDFKFISSSVWKTKNNRSIRRIIFNQALRFLCEEIEESTVRKRWELLGELIDTLTPEDSKIIYAKLSVSKKIAMCVRPEYWMKSYKVIKSLPSKSDRDALLMNLRDEMEDVMEFLDDDFVAEVVFEIADKNVLTDINSRYLALKFVLCTKTEEAHIARYNKIFVPILKKSLPMWNETNNGFYYIRHHVLDLFRFSYMDYLILTKKMILPIPMYTDILKRLRDSLVIEENYIIITTRKLSLGCLKIYDRLIKTNETLILGAVDDAKYERLRANVVADFCKLSVNYLRDDITNYSPQIFIIFAKAFRNTCEEFNFSVLKIISALKVILEKKDFIPGYLFVLEILSYYAINTNDEKAVEIELLKIISTHPSKEVKLHYSVAESRRVSCAYNT